MQGLPLPSCTFAQSLKSVEIIPSLLLCNFPSPTLLLLSPSQQAQPRGVINTCHFVSNLLQEEQRRKEESVQKLESQESWIEGRVAKT